MCVVGYFLDPFGNSDLPATLHAARRGETPDSESHADSPRPATTFDLGADLIGVLLPLSDFARSIGERLSGVGRDLELR